MLQWAISATCIATKLRDKLQKKIAQCTSEKQSDFQENHFIELSPVRASRMACCLA